MHRLIILWAAVGSMIWGLSACLSPVSVPGSGGGRASGAVAENSSPDTVADQPKPYPGSVSAPTPDPTTMLRNSVQGTREVLCRSPQDPAEFMFRLKGQVFKAVEPEGSAPCLDCAGKKLRAVIGEGDDSRFEDGKILESGFFDMTFRAPMNLVSFYVIPALDPYVMMNEGDGCPKGACVANALMQLKNELTFEEPDPVPTCDTTLHLITLPAMKKAGTPGNIYDLSH